MERKSKGMFLGRILDFLFPENTKRRLAASALGEMFRNPAAIPDALKPSTFRKFVRYAGEMEPREVEKRMRRKMSEMNGAAAASGGMPEGPEESFIDYMYGMNQIKHGSYAGMTHPLKTDTDIRLIAFYLPQFHPIPENDEWWGPGFTEWTNVIRGVPQFEGQYQPKMPGELGFYDLRVPEVLQRQAELAEQYGISGFCFHFYWFAGKTLLEMPLKKFAEDKKIKLPFCVNWANENWTRRWDGMDNDILIGQKHSAGDDLEFIRHVSGYFRNERYIRINGKPILMVYRPALMPDPGKTAEIWRGWCRKNGLGDIYLVVSHSFEHMDPVKIGYDAAAEFAPNTFPLTDITGQFKIMNRNYSGQIFDYRSAVDLAKKYKKPDYKKFRGICPGWENEARKPGKGTLMANSTPELYKEWLKAICRFTEENFGKEEKIVFINAWNEWAEGAYLEPDRRFGYAYLKATSDAALEAATERPGLQGKQQGEDA